MARRIRLDFFTGASGTGNSPQFEWPGGDGVFLVGAGSGTVGLQVLGPDGVWVPVINYAATTNIAVAAGKQANFRVPNGQMRAAAGATTGVTCSAVGVPGNVGG